jgi:FMN phosphatase YigB (HAD superfamily)
METQIQNSSQPQIRFVLACSGSDSTVLVRIFSHAQECAAASRLVPGRRESDTPDHSIFHNPTEHRVFQAAKKAAKKFLIDVQELGCDTQKGERGYDDVFPNPGGVGLSRLLIFIREPIRTFDTWKKGGWTDIDRFLDCYRNLLRIVDFSNTEQPCVVLHERLVRNPSVELKRICQRWEIPFSSVDQYSGAVEDLPFHGLVSTEEKDVLECKIGGRYLDLWEPKVLDIRAMLKEKEWFGFDLDDTLHEFRKASSAATEAALGLVAEKYVLCEADLKETYSQVLAQSTSTAFVEGKSSHEYRKERFSAVFERHSILADHSFLEGLLVTYERALTAAMELKCGAFDLLKRLKALGKKIVVITEGPEDAQQRTVHGLGIAHMIDFLATTNSFRVSKTSGLFGKVLAHLNITAADIAYVGDNADRDMAPAIGEGIYSIHYAEQKHFSLDTNPIMINTLRKLENIIS